MMSQAVVNVRKDTKEGEGSRLYQEAERKRIWSDLVSERVVEPSRTE
jgi:hypothetical protein